MQALKTLGKNLKYIMRILKSEGFLNYETDAEILFCFLLKLKRSDLYLNFYQTLTENELAKINRLVELRLAHLPIQYITHQTAFMGIDFQVSKDVFIPRPETEILVEKVLSISKKMSRLKPFKLVELGTGTGIIAISLVYFLKTVKVYAIDISEKAIVLARKNALKHHCQKNIDFIKGDFINIITQKFQTNSLDGIISNPPYIPKNEIDHLSLEIKNHEPHTALDGGMDGLFYYEKIIKHGTEYLKKGGFLAMEMGMGQTKSIKKMIIQKGDFRENIEIIKDYSGIERVIVAYKK